MAECRFTLDDLSDRESAATLVGYITGVQEGTERALKTVALGAYITFGIILTAEIGSLIIQLAKATKPKQKNPKKLEELKGKKNKDEGA